MASEPTNWDASKVQQASSRASSPKYPRSRGWSYEYGLGMSQGAFQAYKAAGKPYNAVLTLADGRRRHGLPGRALNNPKLKVYYYTAGNSQIRVALTAAMMKLKGAKIPPKIVFPIELQNQAKRTVREGIPAGGIRDLAHAAQAAAPDVPIGGSRTSH